MLYPRPLKRPATRVSTPNLFSTNTEMVCRIAINQKTRVPEGNGGRPEARNQTPGHVSRNRRRGPSAEDRWAISSGRKVTKRHFRGQQLISNLRLPRPAVIS